METGVEGGPGKAAQELLLTFARWDKVTGTANSLSKSQRGRSVPVAGSKVRWDVGSSSRRQCATPGHSSNAERGVSALDYSGLAMLVPALLTIHSGEGIVYVSAVEVVEDYRAGRWLALLGSDN